MTRFARFSMIFALAAGAATPAAAERYAVTFAGAPVMTLTLDLVARDGAYRADIRAQGDVLAAIDARLSGLDADGLRTYSFDADVGGWRQKTTVETTPGAPPRRVSPAAGARLAPPLGALDPIAALVTALRAAEDGRCPAAMTVFDGWRAIAIVFSPVAAAPDDDDAALRCGFEIETEVAGGADPHSLDRFLDAGEALFLRKTTGVRLEALRVGPPIFGLRIQHLDDDPPPPAARPVRPLEGNAL